MAIFYHEGTRTFHLQNEQISYVMRVLPSGLIGQLYYGKRIHDRENFDYLLESAYRGYSVYQKEEDGGYSQELLMAEYPSFGQGDFRHGALEVRQANGSRVVYLQYRDYQILEGKPGLEGLPAVYTENDSEAQTLILHAADPDAGIEVDLLYTIFSGYGILARSAKIRNTGGAEAFLEQAMSLCLDLPDDRYEWIQFSGAWACERTPVCRKLDIGTIQAESMRGNSSHQQNPFVILKRPNADEDNGEVIGVSFLYSGNFLISAQVDPARVTRLTAGIHPNWFSWKLLPGEEFQTPEAVLVFSEEGLNGMSRQLHTLYRSRLMRGAWKNTPRPILLNNWEATYFNFNEEKLLKIAAKAKECGVELFVLDDGWFGSRRSDNAGLGDWYPALELLPEGIKGLSEKVEALGLRFGLWIEPEMVNPDSDLFRAHPDWCLHVPGRTPVLSRGQLVLDYSREEVVDYIYGLLHRLLSDSKVSYIKWDMNRSITDCFSAAAPADRQGEVYHRYILGVYRLYERLIGDFPNILFESCAGGGGRFDAGMLYYAPQAWASDDSDAMERTKIQYGTSYGYPIVSIGSHVSAVPNHQVGRITSLKTRAEVAYFGTYGYELDLNILTPEEQEEVKCYTRFMKEYRELIQYGDFYRLSSPFTENDSAWMVVSKDRKTAIAAWYRTLATVNPHFTRIFLRGLDPKAQYRIRTGEELYAENAECSEDCKAKETPAFYGDELMNAGLMVDSRMFKAEGETSHDFLSKLFLLEAE